MSNNFNFVGKFGNENLLSSLEEIENKINENDFPFVLELGKIIRETLRIILPPMILRSNMNSPLKRDDLSFDELFECFKDEFKTKKNPKGVSEKIPLAFRSINIAQNNNFSNYSKGSHIAKVSFDQKINLLRQAYIILAFINNNWFSIGAQLVEDTNFDDSAYYENNNQIKSISNVVNIDNKFRNGSDDNLIEIVKMSISEMLLSKKIAFNIPPYQRNYSWSKTYVEDLLNGIYENYSSNSESQFFGTVAITTEKDEEGLIFKLIDGQQRITTSIIIFKAIFNKMMRFGKIQDALPIELREQFKKDIEGKYPQSLIKKIAKRGNYINSDIELEALGKILLLNSFEEEPKNVSNYKNTNVAKNYFIIREFLEKKIKTYSQLEEFYKYFSSRYVVAVINFKKTLNQEMEIFENLNSKGMDLGVMDLIKNTIFLKMDQDFFVNNEEIIVDIFSRNIDLKNKINIKDNTNSITSNREKMQKLEKEFFYGYIAFRTKELPANSSAKRLLRSFNSKILANYSRIHNFETYKSLSQELGKYIQIFLDILQFEEYANINYFVHDLYNELHIFKEKRALIPILYYLLDLYSNFNWIGYRLNMSISDEDKANLQKSLLEIEKWVVSLIQTKGSGTSPMKYMLNLMKFLDKKKWSEKFKEKVPMLIRGWLCGEKGGNEELESGCPKIESQMETPPANVFYESLVNDPIKPGLQAILAKRLEMQAFTRWGYDQEKLFKKGSVEHIIPQKIEKTEWIDRLSNEKVNKNEIPNMHSYKKDKLGNLLWIPQRLNSSMSNKTFEIKRDIYYKADIAAAKLFIDEKNSLNLLTIDRFDYSVLEKRTIMMANLLMNIYDWN